MKAGMLSTLFLFMVQSPAQALVVPPNSPQITVVDDTPYCKAYRRVKAYWAYYQKQPAMALTTLFVMGNTVVITKVGTEIVFNPDHPFGRMVMQSEMESRIIRFMLPKIVFGSLAVVLDSFVPSELGSDDTLTSRYRNEPSLLFKEMSDKDACGYLKYDKELNENFMKTEKILDDVHRDPNSEEY